ncbi:hypothetical protein BJX61DRAFT_539818 [Aspergillus egyptiacus]|nr:hypothetical protein BJX61DRAFT_539818 [Aspergillus egyptiacus]
MPESDSPSVVPAQLSFLAIYNPQLGTTDETLRDQVVFYTSRSSLLRRQDSSAATDEDGGASDDWNERLRQIGLAQGMVSFAKNFSEGKAVDYVETEKSQIVLHELEKDWWILASIDLTRLPANPNNVSSSSKDAPECCFHYSSREVAPPQLLIKQLRRAHTIFLLNHASSLDILYKSAGRSSLCLFLENFWLRFAWNWEVLLNGNPVVEMYNGIKLSAGGELGIGVGEEEWGSGEREVLEDFVSRTDGLVDLVVSRFGDPGELTEDHMKGSKPEGDTGNRWLGSDAYPRPSDGVIFSGVGAITRQSIVTISQWMEWIHRYGPDAYGVGEDPTFPRRRRRRRRQQGTTTRENASSQSPTPSVAQGTGPNRPFSPGIPRPLVTGMPPPQPTSRDQEEKARQQTSDENSQGATNAVSDWVTSGTETFVKYLTLGYGSSWGLSSGSPGPRPQTEHSKGEDDSGQANGGTLPEGPKPEFSRASRQTRCLNRGSFLIGLQNGTTSPDIPLGETEPTDSVTVSNEKIVRRTIHVQLADSQQSSAGSTQLRAIVYIHRPFIYTFLFDTTVPSLEDLSLYHRIHHQLGPLQKPLSNSTSPSTAQLRISSTREPNPQTQHQNAPLYDLVYDPHNLTIRSSIPNIPDLIPNPHQPPSDPASLSRIEAISIHHRLLTTYNETRARPLELERTCKTRRGWWIVWVRVSPHTDKYPVSNADTERDKQEEAFLIRQASDHPSLSSSHARNTSSIGGGSGSAQFFRDLGGATSPGFSQASRLDMGPAKLVEGLGLDTRRYIENLLSFNR